MTYDKLMQVVHVFILTIRSGGSKKRETPDAHYNKAVPADRDLVNDDNGAACDSCRQAENGRNNRGASSK
eukprot:4995689-Pleurochrysis_carterae.AAC.5